MKENSTAQLQKGEIDNLDLNKMQSIIRNMPQYGELLVRYSLHMYMAQKALDVFNGSGLKKVGDVEQTIATGVDSQSNLPSSSDIYSDAVKLLGDPMLPADFKLRLAILLNTSIDMNDQNFNIVKNSLSDSSDLKAVDNLVYLGVKNDNSKGKTKSKIPDEMKKVYKKISEDSKYDLTRFTPALTFLLEQIFSDKLNRNKYSSTFYPAASPTKKSLPSELSSFKTNNLSKGITTASKEKLIVFFVGGITFPEIQAAKTFDSSINKSEILTVCGGTSTLTPSAFIQELLGIGFSRGGY